MYFHKSLFSVSILIRTFLVGVSIKTLVETRLRKTGIMLVYRSKKSRDDTGFQELDTVNHIVRDAEKLPAISGSLWPLTYYFHKSSESESYWRHLGYRMIS